MNFDLLNCRNRLFLHKTVLKDSMNFNLSFVEKNFFLLVIK